MRLPSPALGRLIALGGIFVLGGCSSPPPADATRLTLNNPYWDRVNVQLVVTRNSDCERTDEGVIDKRELVMIRNQPELIDVPNGATVCWRRDRDPDKPEAGIWTGWTKAMVYPGSDARANL